MPGVKNSIISAKHKTTSHNIDFSYITNLSVSNAQKCLNIFNLLDLCK